MMNDSENFFGKIIERVSEEFPEGMMLDYCGISFYVKYYSVCEDMFCDFAESKDQGLWVVCEYFDPNINDFKEKYFSENFIRNRMKILNFGR